MERTHPFAFPLLMNEPVGRRVGERGTDDAERFAGDKARLSEQSRALRPRQRPAGTEGAIFARQRISSAIQFPIPAKPFCIRTTALIGARA